MTTGPRYDFRTRWLVDGLVADVADVMFDVPAAATWCPAVYRRAAVVRDGDETGLGTVVELRAAARIGYTLTFRLQVTEIGADACAFIATGDLAGDGEWTLAQRGERVEVSVRWRVGVTRPWMRRLEPVLRPFFLANHDWAMATSRRCLVDELARRAAAR